MKNKQTTRLTINLRKNKKARQTKSLCLLCRDSGHIAGKCSRSEPKYRGQSWTYTSERAQKLRALMETPSNRPCQRCEDLNLLDMFEGSPDWTGSTSRHQEIANLRSNRHYRNLGTAGVVIFRDDCPVCIALFACTPSPAYLTDEVHLLADWTVHRLERLVEIQSDTRNTYDKCLLVDVEAPDGEISLDEQQGDALGLVRESPAEQSLGAHPVNPEEVDIALLNRYLASCERHHKLTCTPMGSGDLNDILLIDVVASKLVRYRQPGCEYMTLSYVWGSPDQARARQYKIGDNLTDLPQTIEDAMKLCRALDKRYLWVRIRSRDIVLS